MNDEQTLDVASLTQREKEVLGFLVQGLSNKEIADKLFVSTHTVKAHVQAILRKFNTKNRAFTCYLAGKNNLV